MFEEPLVFPSTEGLKSCIIWNVQLSSPYGSVTSTSRVSKELLASLKVMQLEYRMNGITGKCWGLNC